MDACVSIRSTVAPPCVDGAAKKLDDGCLVFGDHAAATFAAASARTVKTGHVARRTTGSAVDPNSIRSIGFLPWIPSTIRSLRCSAAMRRIS